MKKQIFYLLLVSLVFISCSEEPTKPAENEYETGTIKDVEGNVYKIIRIGSQWWMAENLRVTKYSNREWIVNIASSKTWPVLSMGAFCNYDNNFDNKAVYGNLYNWYTVHDSRKIAPDGWHVPTDAEWQTLVNFLGGNTLAGGKMKSTGSMEAGDGLWRASNESATNESGFSALPAGYRSSHGMFDGIGSTSYFWSSTESSDSTAWYRHLSSSNSDVYRYDSDRKQAGYSVRCIRD